MKKILIVMTVALIFCNWLVAQNSNQHNNQSFHTVSGIDSIAQKTASELKQLLGLSETQASNIYMIEKDFLGTRSNLSGSLTTVERRNEISRLNKKREDDIKEILSVLQYQQYQQLVAERQKMMEEKRKQMSAAQNNQR